MRSMTRSLSILVLVAAALGWTRADAQDAPPPS